MALRLIEINVPSENKHEIEEIIKETNPISFWIDRIENNKAEIKILLHAEKTEVMLDSLEKKLTAVSDYRIVLLPVETTLPRVTIEDEKKEITSASKNQKLEKTPLRISREELYTKIQDGANITPVYIAMVILSAIVASIGLLNDSVAVIIGAMVIAPLLGPNVALSLATTLGDWELGKNALKANILGMLIALVFAVVIGLIVHVDVSSTELISRSHVAISDIILALASGSAAALAFTSGVSAALIGVMVAVALLPPLVTFGLFLSCGNFQLATGALLLLFTNLISLNLAGVLTFIIQGIQPRRWWEAKKAKKSTRIATVIWTLLLLVLILLIKLQQ